MTILPSRQDVQSILTMQDTINILDSAFADLARGEAIMPQRTPIVVPEHTGLAIQDISTAFHVYTQAQARGLGTAFSF